MTTRIATPGIYDMPAEDYHADPCPLPSLSSSIAHKLLNQSPRHAWWAHPKLNPDFPEPESTASQDEGTILHAMILEPSAAPIWKALEFDAYTTKAAREARDAARDEGLIPILARRLDGLSACARAAHQQLANHEAADAFTDGQSERTLLWQENTEHGPIWCRARVDWLGNGPKPRLDDLKTVAQSAEPLSWAKKLSTEGYAFQAAFYCRGAQMCGLAPRSFRFIVVEREPPYYLSVVSPGAVLEEFAGQQVERAIDAWGRCLHGNDWPGYPRAIFEGEAAAWAVAQQEERHMRAVMEAEAQTARRAKLDAAAARAAREDEQRTLIMKTENPWA